MRQAASLLIAIALLFTACGSDENDAIAEDASDLINDSDLDLDEATDATTDAGKRLEEQLGDADLSTLYGAMDLSGFDDFETDEAFTLFAPNDAAFSAMTADEMADLLADPEMVAELLSDHYVTKTLMASDLADESSAVTAGGLALLFDTTGETPTVNGINIVRTDLTAGNGVVHIIDGVLMSDNS